VERNRLKKEIDRLDGLVRSTSGKLDNPSFVERAPADVVAREREKLASLSENLGKLKQNYDALT
jgi:valyl-tRNA synthetase